MKAPGPPRETLNGNKVVNDSVPENVSLNDLHDNTPPPHEEAKYSVGGHDNAPASSGFAAASNDTSGRSVTNANVNDDSISYAVANANANVNVNI